MGKNKICLVSFCKFVICMLFSFVVDGYWSICLQLFFLLSPFNSLTFFVSKRLQKNYGRKEGKRLCYLSTQNFISGFIPLLCSEEMSSWTMWKQSNLPNKILKYNSHFSWVKSQTSVVMSGGVFSNICFAGVSLLAADMSGHKTRSAHVFTASNQGKKRPYSLRDTA